VCTSTRAGGRSSDGTRSEGSGQARRVRARWLAIIDSQPPTPPAPTMANRIFVGLLDLVVMISMCTASTVARQQQRARARGGPPGRALRYRPKVYSPPQESQQLPTLSFTRRSELISKIYAVGGLMGNDHIVSLRTGDALVQRHAPALG
jgi:hypothetical protein